MQDITFNQFKKQLAFFYQTSSLGSIPAITIKKIIDADYNDRIREDLELDYITLTIIAFEEYRHELDILRIDMRELTFGSLFELVIQDKQYP